jgi:hypothetical protein
MKLHPKRPPGSMARKALAYTLDIHQLRAQGYTFEAIREALAEVGVHVSNTTVQRELRRAACPRETPTAATGCLPAAGLKAGPSGVPPLPVAQPSSPAVPSPRSAVPADQVSPSPASAGLSPLRGKDLAAAFMEGRFSNPLLRAKASR